MMDVFALPVEGTEMRMNAHEEAYEYMTTYTESCKRVREAGLKMGGRGKWRCGLSVASRCFVRAAVIIKVQIIYTYTWKSYKWKSHVCYLAIYSTVVIAFA